MRSEVVIQFRPRERGGAWKDAGRLVTFPDAVTAEPKMRELQAKNPKYKYRMVRRQVEEEVLEAVPEPQTKREALVAGLESFLGSIPALPFGRYSVPVSVTRTEKKNVLLVTLHNDPRLKGISETVELVIRKPKD